MSISRTVITNKRSALGTQAKIELLESSHSSSLNIYATPVSGRWQYLNIILYSIYSFFPTIKYLADTATDHQHSKLSKLYCIRSLNVICILISILNLKVT
jgi:hypothetical protein